MNTLVTFIVLFFSAAVMNAQEVIELKEAKVEVTPLFTELSGNRNSFSANIVEAHAGEFEKDPVRFLEKHVSMKEFIAFTQGTPYSFYEVVIRSKKGHLKANYDEDGKLITTSYKFKSVTLPYDVIQQLYLENRGYSLVKSLHTGKAKAGEMPEAYYELTLKNGKDKRNIKLRAVSHGWTEVAYLE